MKVKLFEVRDKGTLVPFVAVKPEPDNEAEDWLIRRSGFGPDSNDLIICFPLETLPDKATYDYLDWGLNRSRAVAHTWISKMWDKLNTGDVIDVEYILGESAQPKTSERL